MVFKRVVAIIRGSVLGAVETSLKQLGINGIIVSQVKGYGEYANLNQSNWMVSNARIEIFTSQEQVDSLVAVMPVEKLYRVRTKTERGPD